MPRVFGPDCRERDAAENDHARQLSASREREHRRGQPLVARFFFFKQQTAYEVTYGDWSSDVCSSDLLDRQPTDLSGAWHHTGDVSSEADVAGFAAAVHDRFGQVDVLVNNAGIAYI